MEYIFHIFILIFIYGILAIAQNLVMGSTGLLTLGGAAFYGIGAYTAAILATKFGVNIFASLALAPILAGIIACVVGVSFARFRDDYFMLATLGFLMIFHTVVRNWEELTGGAYGIAGISKPELFNFTFQTPASFLLLALAIFLLTLGISYRISRSSFGRVLNAIREDEDALKIFGYKTSSYKLLAFTLGASLSACAGVLFASYITFIDSNFFTINESLLLWSMIILGGIGRNRGAVVGAFILIIVPEFLRFVGFPTEFAGLLRQFIYGSLLVLLMLFRPNGILGKYKL
ncbi:MAG: Inner-membrane translocator [Candidatus Nomurabacteria bacterium GW2011_GWF2_40_31]|uniref:Inner-membrane translocator n=2 Tax=Candidatus Nomuraibacteriota TaxID=1752729 RepID=A0A837HWC9_9BACT|nr:MAG: Inner-membrane translocator [Candidatus Nomurabacteria bacterium GW2011_GWD2_39_12]KKR20708.1 MAG: Inner-membrane translocator [Candidatus Nomurabacteria bacterium GW2011_GWC2_39_41]KKR37364.1 MAG: Inner-membrane translocator [Candidatus Nomurabacteria bacterium GW2011_GWE2_40_10]KKR38611.1 MAG: Inner-membrane translocator [Candidatus Nomurabacteria bacterium GW2011_GWB1_40_11]KKR40336.1 MAG: Inner-membrane translocator [Parcubacteria group bacterium GW2011_GWC1_40_11]KKR59555.1 MAG: I